VKIDLFNIDDFVRINKSPRVTNPVFFNYDKTPTSDGLFSYELFGVSDKDRKNIFGYVDLKGPYIHPLIYTMMSKRMGALKDLLSGEKHAVIADKRIVYVTEDTPGSDTGIDFLYDNFDKIDWLDEVEEEEMDSIDKKTRLKFLRSIKREEFFCTKWLVLPPFYRAQSSDNRTLGDSINSIYKDLISRTNSMSTGFGLSMFGNQTKFKIQTTLVQLFEETTRPIKGKGSLLRKHLLGKSIDYTSSNVITSPPISNSTSLDDMPVKFGYGGFPISTVVSLFHPFFVTYITEFLSRIVKEFILYSFRDDIKNLDLGQFSTQAAEKMIKAFIKSEEERFEPFKVEYSAVNGKKKTIALPMLEFRSEQEYKSGRGRQRLFTIMDLFYMTAKQVIDDKHVYVTRYPAINFQNIYPSKINLLTTNKTRKDYFIKFMGIESSINDMVNSGKGFIDYPYIRFEGDDSPSPNTYYSFLNVFTPGNVYLKALGGDYDGDMLYLRGVFTKEANAEAEKLIYSKSNVLTANGSTSRGLGKIARDAALAAYELTKDGR
jgi:DNA-directed RNA polymerase beta' subunit